MQCLQESAQRVPVRETGVKGSLKKRISLPKSSSLREKALSIEALVSGSVSSASIMVLAHWRSEFIILFMSVIGK